MLKEKKCSITHSKVPKMWGGLLNRINNLSSFFFFEISLKILGFFCLSLQTIINGESFVYLCYFSPLNVELEIKNTPLEKNWGMSFIIVHSLHLGTKWSFRPSAGLIVSAQSSEVTGSGCRLEEVWLNPTPVLWRARSRPSAPPAGRSEHCIWLRRKMMMMMRRWHGLLLLLFSSAPLRSGARITGSSSIRTGSRSTRCPWCHTAPWRRPSWPGRPAAHSQYSPAEAGRDMHPLRWSPYR